MELKRTAIKGMSVVSVDDTQNTRTGVVTGAGKTLQPTQIVSPYGLCSNPPPNSLGISLNLLGNASDNVTIVDHPNLRKKNLLSGEVAVVNYLTGSNIYIKTDGSIDITSASGATILMAADGSITITGTTTTNINATTTANITAPAINLNGVVNVNGALTATGAIGATDLTTSTIASVNAHVHSAGTLQDSTPAPCTGSTGTGV